ncbi:plasmid pRiA4b ORF-3 family protein [Leptolyngbya sp. PCC 6406]|uniref:plasmid pRiA4b ORF-3 family protein n=1 Tax=Leptolyngbya sp. PCC 6406 TaxID=1173264 RepID=UPI0002ACD1B6|nr:plasmid pRiA4b ORF-3 family protein [Leptolyngbya sp. PCC 6406]
MTSNQLWHWHITVADSEPPIWRRFQVSSSVTLAQFHGVIQAVMGWQDCHAYRFQYRRQTYALPGVAPARATAATPQDVTQVTLADLGLAPPDDLTYTYDFQSGWLHVLRLEAVTEGRDQPIVAHCLEGEMACPPEGSGGVWGYGELLERLADPEDPEYEMLLNWIGLDFDPDKFDRSGANQRLGAVG